MSGGLFPLQTAVCVYAALVLARAALLKSRDLTRFEAALAGYRLLPDAAVAPTAYAVPLVEAVVAAALFYSPTRAWGAPAAASLLGVFALAVSVNLLRGRRELDCGCGGAPRPISFGLAIQNGVTAVALAGVALAPAQAGSVAAWVVGVAAGLTALILHLGHETLSAAGGGVWPERLPGDPAGARP